MNGMWYFFLGMGLAAGICWFLWWCHCKRQRGRLQALTVYLEAASCGKETTLARTEDEFSMLEDEIYKTVSELRIAHEQAQKKRKQQADNLADIAHQLKTPLTSMSLMTQLLGSDASKEQQEYIGRIDTQLVRLNWLTASLLTMSRLDAGAVEFAPVTLSFEELVDRALETTEQFLRERKQTVLVLGKECLVTCDPYWTAEALVNFVKNCSEHTPAEGTITIKAVSLPLYLQITVEDSGMGFVPEEIPYLFQRFFRGRNSHKDSIGIGLALSLAIIEGQGGILRAQNRPEGGAQFIIRFYP